MLFNLKTLEKIVTNNTLFLCPQKGVWNPDGPTVRYPWIHRSLHVPSTDKAICSTQPMDVVARICPDVHLSDHHVVLRKRSSQGSHELHLPLHLHVGGIVHAWNGYQLLQL